MAAETSRRVLTGPDAPPLAMRAAAPEWAACPGCRHTLDLHQPFLRHPYRLIGACEACERLYQIRMEPEEAEASVVILPDWPQEATDPESPPPGRVPNCPRGMVPPRK